MSDYGDTGKASWWIVISSDSWVNKVHGAFTLKFLARKNAISADGKGHLHTSA